MKHMAFSQIRAGIGSFVFLIIICGCTSISHNRDKLIRITEIKSFLNSLPFDERLLLEIFFRTLIQEDVIGYTLLGGKAMSFHSYLQPKPILNSYHSKSLNWIDRMDLVFEGFNENYVLFHKGLEIWKKYEYLFCGKNIFFDVIGNNDELYFMKVAVLNKRLLFSIFDKYFHKFINFDPSIQDEESLFELLLHDSNFKKKFYSREDLVGICLGYGEKNAKLFQKMTALHRSCGRLGFTLNMPSSARLRKIEDELTALGKFFHVGVKDHISRKFLFHVGIGFRADFSDPETIDLQNKYTSYHKKLTLMYDGANFLEKTLELIALANACE